MNAFARICAMFLILTAPLAVRPDQPVRLAIVSNSPEGAVASDVLTAQFSSDPKVQLIERDQVERVYREQGMTATVKDCAKLGQLLGADGLAVLEASTGGRSTNLMVRLVAVKPGVVLAHTAFPWPMANLLEWSKAVAKQLTPVLPKLLVLVNDAIPISVVNLRVAAPGIGAQESEQQLKLLTIERLSQERQFFVLERRQMHQLAEEKDLNSDESAFWNGRYLLEGVVDANGFHADTITIDVRLAPPHGGIPLVFSVTGQRTNYWEAVNRMALKIVELLKVCPSVIEWNAGDESTRFFEEAKWALKWKVYSEAQAAIESAWALGLRSQECAEVRVRSYLIPPDTSRLRKGGLIVGDSEDRDEIFKREIKNLSADHLALFTAIRGIAMDYVAVEQAPDQRSIDVAQRALELYRQSSQNLQTAEIKPDSAWHQVGVEALRNASQVLQLFCWSPKLYQPLTDKLTELRSAARAVAEWLTQVPAIRNSYHTGGGLMTRDEIGRLYGYGRPNVFMLEASIGSLWQERPEDTLAMYRGLMESPTFGCIHQHLWGRESSQWSIS